MVCSDLTAGNYCNPPGGVKLIAVFPDIKKAREAGGFPCLI
jgi:hypothetical protein